jgi:ABC-type phosphate/phosphonate transport system substrate-binding protein
MRIKFFLYASVLLSVGILLGRGETIVLAETPPTYIAGVMAKSYDEKRAMALEKFAEILGRYFEERADIKIRLKAMTFPDLAKAIEKGSVDFIWGYGLVVSAELSQKFPIIPILAPTLGEERRTPYRRLAIAAKDSIASMADLKGKRLTHVGDEQWCFELLLFKVWAAEKLGVKDIRQLFELKAKEPDEGYFIPASKRGAIYSLMIKEADLAVAHEFEYITQEKLTPHAIRERTEILPFFNSQTGFMEAPVFVRRGVNKADIDKLVKVLTEMPGDPEGKQILLSSKISGFVKVTDQDYRSVRALMAKKEGLGIR